MNKEHKLYLTGFFLILFLPLMAISPWFFPPEWGKAMAFRIILSLMMLLFIWQLSSDKNFFLEIRQKYNSAKKAIQILLLVIFVASIATLFSSDITFSFWSSPHRSGGLVNFIFCLILSIVLFLVTRERGWKKLWDFAFLIGDLVVLFAIVQYFNLLPSILIAYQGRPPSTLSNPILLAIYLNILIFPALSNALLEKSKKSIFYWASILLFVFGIFVSGSRAAYLGLALAGFYFFLLYPKKMKKVKLAVFCVLTLMVAGILFTSLSPKLPSFIENNPRLSYIAQRISTEKIFTALGQTRFSGWQTFSNAVKERPIFGWGVENQAVAFDKYYNPNLDYLVVLGRNWWDRAHNIFLDLSVSYGIPFLIIYLFFFGYIFWKLQKNKTIQPERRMSSHAVQSVLMAYFTALFFGFDSVTTYLMLFFIVGYSLYLIHQIPEQNQKEPEPTLYYKLFKNRKVIVSVFAVLMIFFLWQYALKPLYINSVITRADKANCSTKLSSMAELLESRSFLDSYIRLKYVEHVKSCESYIEEDEIGYIKKVVDELKEAARIQPNYTRTWILLAEFNNTLLAITKDPEVKESLKKDSLYYVAEAKKLSPLRYEVYVIEAKTYFVLLDFENTKKISEECISIDKNATGCYWYLGLAQIMTKEKVQGEKNIELAKEKGYSYNNTTSLSQLALAYTKNNNYKELIPIYKRLADTNANNADFRSTLAFLYREIGDYENARIEAVSILRYHPGMQQEVQEFLLTLPY